MRIVHITSEISPIAKVGGLADVVFGLSKELVSMGHDVTVILPKYDLLLLQELQDLHAEKELLTCSEGPFQFNNTIWKAKLYGINLVLIEPAHTRAYFNRKTIYGCTDDTDRFLYFCRVACDYLLKEKKPIAVVHLHDWMTAAVALLYKTVYKQLGLSISTLLFTIHNLAYQGLAAQFNLTRIGLDEEIFPELEDPNHVGLMNLMKGAILYADQITTVSPNYAKEILTPEGGCGLDPFLLERLSKLHGILNGIDHLFWDPATDPHLVARYQLSDGIDAIRNAKEKNKIELQRRLKMRPTKHPLVACISRLVPQKGCDLIQYAIDHSLEMNGQFVLLGSSSSKEIELSFERQKRRLEGNRDVAILLKHDETIAHLIFAAADLFIIPSLFEPCGLTQIIALRYGTIPIARATGGLLDTVFDLETSSLPYEERNGFIFEYPDQQGIDWGVNRAFALFNTSSKAWSELMLHAMQRNLSWGVAAREYLKLYTQTT